MRPCKYKIEKATVPLRMMKKNTTKNRVKKAIVMESNGLGE